MFGRGRRSEGVHRLKLWAADALVQPGCRGGGDGNNFHVWASEEGVMLGLQPHSRRGSARPGTPSRTRSLTVGCAPTADREPVRAARRRSGVEFQGVDDDDVRIEEEDHGVSFSPSPFRCPKPAS